MSDIYKTNTRKYFNQPQNQNYDNGISPTSSRSSMADCMCNCFKFFHCEHPQTQHSFIYSRTIAYTFSSLALSIPLFLIIFLFLLPSFTHGIHHLTSMTLQTILLVLLLFIFFTSLLTSTLLYVCDLFRINLLEPNMFLNVKPQNLRRKITFFLSTQIPLTAIIAALSLYIFYSLVSTSKQKPPLTDQQIEEQADMLHNVLQIFLKEKLADNLAAITTLIKQTIPMFKLPEQKIDIDATMESILKPEYYYYVAAIIKTLKLFIIAFGTCLNFVLIQSILYSLRYLNFVKLVEYTERCQGFMDQEVMNSTRRSNQGIHKNSYGPFDKFVPMNSEEEATMMISRGQHSQNSPGTQTTPLYSPETTDQTGYFREQPSNKNGFIEIPFIEKPSSATEPTSLEYGNTQVNILR